MNKRFLSILAAAAIMMSLLPGMASVRDMTVLYDDAILYTVSDDGFLEFNVVYSADVSGAAIVDNTGSGIDSVALLKEVMGTPDAPAVVHSVSFDARTLGKAVTANLELDKNSKVTKVTITDIRTRPVVGISWKSNSIGSDYQGFAQAFERNGAYAVYLPQVTTAEEAREILSQLNGLFMTGGEDWNPSLYGEEQTPHGSSGWNDARDTSDIHLIQQAVAMDVPMLAVCRGEQGFNVAMGGGLIQDIPYYLGQQVQAGKIDLSRVTAVLNDTGYNKWDSETGTYKNVSSDCITDPHYRAQIDGLIHSGGTGYHKVEAASETTGIDVNSKWLYDIIGSASIEMVATAHHQAVNPEKLGEGLTIVAYATDGIVEAIEHQDSLFALGVQWHPERDALRDTRGSGVDLDLCNALLGALVEYAGTHKDLLENSGSDSSFSSSSSNCNAGMTSAMMLLVCAAAVAVKTKR